MSFQIIHHLPSSDSVKLPFRQSCVEHPHASVHILHGLAEHSGRYARFSASLNRAGYNVYAQDHRGHGANIGSHAGQGSFAARDGSEIAIADVLALNQYIHQSHPGLPIILFGHSMGGLLAINYLLQHPKSIDAAAIWNSNIGSSTENALALSVLYAERMFKGSDVPSTILPRLTFRTWAAMIKDRETQFNWLSHDPAEVATYIRDPLCGFDASVGLWINIFQLMNNVHKRIKISQPASQLPIHLVGGGQDPATNMGVATSILAKRLKTLGFQKVETLIYPENRHECLNEFNRDQVTQNFLIWLSDMLPSGAKSR